MPNSIGLKTGTHVKFIKSTIVTHNNNTYIYM